MAKFRNVAGYEPVSAWWDNGGNQIAFSRGSKAFISINNENFDMDIVLKTGLTSGNYCDIISGNIVNGSCSGKIVNVNTDGSARIFIKYFEEDPIIALHIEFKL
jgi:alpha-amylase